jgi:hypothetical protein
MKNLSKVSRAHKLQGALQRAVITYEVIKIWKALGTRALEAFFGIRK